MPRSLALGLVALGALALGAWLWSTGSSRRVAAEAAQPSAPVAEFASDAPDLEAAPSVPAESSRAAVAVPTPRRGRTLAPDHGPADAELWIDGIVVFPPGTPADEEVSVVASGGGSDWGRTPVGRDGHFRLTVPEWMRYKATRHSLELEARYLWLRVGVPATPNSRNPVKLMPILGGRIEGRVRTAAVGEVFRQASIELRGEDSLRTRRTRPSWPDLTFAFDAVLAYRTYTLVSDEGPLFGSAAGVRVEPGRTSVVELELASGVELAGHVRDEGGQPLAGLEVSATVEGLGRPETMQTGPDGAFRMGVAPGVIRLEAGKSGRSYACLELGRLGAGERREGIELVLRSAGVIAGRVLWPDGAPAQAWVTVDRDDVDPATVGGGHESLQTDARGRFRISGLGADSFLVTAAATRTAGGRTTRWRAEEQRVAPNGGELTLVLADCPSVRGQVVDERGQPMARFEVSARRLDPVDHRRSLGKTLRGTFQPRDGSFQLTGFVPGEWELQASETGQFVSERVLVRVPTSESVVLRVLRTASLGGLVLDASGAPAVGVSVICEGANGLEICESPDTGADGAFVLSSVPSGRVTLTVFRQDQALGGPVELELAPGEERADVVLYLGGGPRR